MWLTGPLVTQDGPSHTYNAWILLNYGTDSLYPKFYDVALYPTTNWLGGMLLTAFMNWLSVSASECLLVTIILFLFVGGSARLLSRTDHDLPPVALLLPAIAINYPLHMGFYSFCLGLALVPWTWVLAKQTCRIPRWRNVLALGLVLVVTFIAHLVASMMALVGVVCLALFSGRDTTKRHAIMRPLLACLPTIALMISYWTRMPTGDAVHWGWDELFETLLTFRFVAAYIGPQEWIGMAMGGSVFALLIVGFRNTEEDRRPWWIIAGIGLLLYAFLPNGAKGHWFLSERLSVLPWLAVLPLCSTTRFRWIQIGGFTTLCGSFLVILAMNQGPLKTEIDAMETLGDRIEPNSMLISLSFDSRPPEPARGQVFLHAIDRIAVTRNAVDIGNYEAQTNHFQTRLKSGVHWPHYNQIEGMPTSINPVQLIAIADYVLTVDLDTHAPEYRPKLAEFYEPLTQSGRFQLFKRRIQRAGVVPSVEEPRVPESN